MGGGRKLQPINHLYAKVFKDSLKGGKQFVTENQGKEKPHLIQPDHAELASPLLLPTIQSPLEGVLVWWSCSLWLAYTRQNKRKLSRIS